MGYMRLCQDRTCLLPYLQGDVSIRPPYTATQISEAALRREVERMHTSAVDETRVFYDRGMAAGDAGVGSWVVRWLLWYTLLHGDEKERSFSADAQPSSLRRHDQSNESPRPGQPNGAPAQPADRQGMFARPRGAADGQV